MNTISEREFLGTVIRLLARNREMSLGQIRNSTRNFRKRRRISNDAVFGILRRYVEEGLIGIIERNSHMIYASKEIEDMSRHGDVPNAPAQEKITKIVENLNPDYVETFRRNAWIINEIHKMEKEGHVVSDKDRENMEIKLALRYREEMKERKEREEDITNQEPDPDTVIAESIAAGNEPFK